MQHNVIKLNSTGNVEHLFAFDSIMNLVPMWPGEKQKTERAILRLVMIREKCVPVYSRDVEKVLQALPCQEAFSVDEFEQKLRERCFTTVTSSAWCWLWELLLCEVYQQPGWDFCSVGEMLLVFTLVVVYALIVVPGTVCMCYIHG